MTEHTTRLTQRLHAIGDSLRDSGHGLALLALGSVGAETARLDAYSDLDFFAIVEDGHKASYIADLGWLSRIHPIGFAFANTPDGYKLLYEDGVFCEFAVFEPGELAHIPFAAGRLVWHAEGFDPALATPKPHTPSARPREWLVNEALSNLYVGMCRYRRGEKLSALMFVQYYPMYYLLELAPLLEAEQSAFPDPFGGERRFERRFPGLAAQLGALLPGYERTPEAARAVLGFLETHFEVNPSIKRAILKLIEER